MSSFNFNLLPKKSRELIEKEKRRDKFSIFYSLLILFSVLIWCFLILFNNAIVDQSVKRWEATNLNKQNKIDTEFLETRQIHGELVSKTNSIAPLIKRDIDPEVVFQVAEEVFPLNDATVVIVGYGRNNDGSFTISISTNDDLIIADKARKLRNLSIVTDLRINRVSNILSDNRITAEFIFSIDNTLI